tara:strand:- start:411 stop:1169 length:759 start_codon:yes stop_codon:yes gene_type:complete
MNEFEVQTLVLKARGIKAADKTVMLVILKHVDWETWIGRITQTYLCEYADIPRATFARAMKRLKAAGWLTVDCDRTAFNKFQTTIKVNIDSIKMSQPLSQNEPIDSIKMTQPLSQNDNTVYQNEPTVYQNEPTMSQNDAYINITNITNKDINIDINKEDLKLVTKEEAMEYTENQEFKNLSHMCDDRGKVPLHVLKALHRRLEIERRWAHHKKTIETNPFNQARIFEAFKKAEIREDFDLYRSNAQIKKTWS